MRIKNQKDFWSGVMFAGFGAFFAIAGSQYKFGTAAKMGPAYFPIALGLLLVMLGIVIAISGVSANATSGKVDRFAWPTLLLILGPVVLFGLLLSKLGLVLCLVMLIAISSFASHEFSWKGMAANAAILIALCMFVFVYALKLPFALWPAFFAA